MWINPLKIAFRTLLKNKFHSFINLAGLVTGMTACWLIAVFVRNELGYDRFLDKAERIFQVNISANFGGSAFLTSNTPPPAGSALQTEYPEIQAYTRMFQVGDVAVGRENPQSEKQFTETGVWAVDSNFLEVFSFPLLEGRPDVCLNEPNAVVLTESIAEKYFGHADGSFRSVLGQTLMLNDRPFKVTGILKSLPRQSSLQFDILAPTAAYKVIERFNWSWVWLQMETFVLLHNKPTEPELMALEAKFPSMVRKYASGAFERIGQPYDEFIKKGGKWELGLKPMTKVHLYSEGVGSRLNTLGSIRDVYVFATVGVLILLLACINFMNLTTARSLTRAREVGVRKVLGSGKNRLVRQFITESILFGCAAGVLAFAATHAVLPVFNRLSGETFVLKDLFAGWAGVLALCLPFVAGLLGGSYPAFYLSSFTPVTILKNKISAKGNTWIKNGLVVFQFAISVGMIVGTLVVLFQIDYTRKKDIGLEKENVLVINSAQRLGEQKESFRQKLEQMPEVVRASLSTDLPAKNAFGDFYVPEPDGSNPGIARDLALSSYMVDYDFVPAMGIRLLQGRNFSRDFPSDSAAVILNETAARIIGWKDPIGQFMYYPGNRNQRFQVIGIMKDFHAQSFRTAIEPFGLFHYSSRTYQLPDEYLAVRIRPGAEKKLLTGIEAEWKVFAPGAPFDYSFLDENFNALYRSEAKLGGILSAFTALSIFIACLGLFGLIALAAEQRTKEIGVRKVLGASVAGIVGLLSRDFLKLVLLSVALAIPFAWYFMDQWLQGFVYRIDLEWWIFAAAGLTAVVIALITLSFQAVRAALANPVSSLKTE